MKSVVYITAIHYAESSLHYYSPVSMLLKSGFNVIILCPGDESVTIRLGALTIKTELRKGGVVFSLYWYIKMFLRTILLCLNKPYDVIYIQGHTASPFFLLKFFAAKKIRLLYHSQDYISSRYVVWRLFEYFVAKAADFVVVNDYGRAVLFRERNGLKELPYVVRTFLPLEPSRTMNWFLKSSGSLANLPSKQDDVLTFIHLGPLHILRKGALIVDFLCKLSKISKIRLICTGIPKSGSVLRGHLSIIEGLSPACEILEFNRLSFSELQSVLRLADFGFLLYDVNDMGNYCQSPGRLTEYLDSGCIPIMSKCPFLIEMQLKHSIGFLLEEDGIDELVASISELKYSAIKEKCNYLTSLRDDFFSLEKQFGLILKDIS